MEASVRVAGKGYGRGRAREGRAYGVPKMELRFEDNGYAVGLLEQTWVMGKCGSEFWCGVTRSVTLP